MRRAAAIMFVATLTACASTPAPLRPVVSRPPPVRSSATPVAAPPSDTFIPPVVMRLPGLEAVIGADQRRLTELFGPARLTVPEGDAVKLQFAGTSCVLDVYLYPLRPGGQPAATHVEARRASDGQDVDRAACVAALRR